MTSTRFSIGILRLVVFGLVGIVVGDDVYSASCDYLVVDPGGNNV